MSRFTSPCISSHHWHRHHSGTFSTHNSHTFQFSFKAYLCDCHPRRLRVLSLKMRHLRCPGWVFGMMTAQVGFYRQTLRDSTPGSRFLTPGFGVLWRQTPGSRLHRPCKHGILTISPIHGSKTIIFQWLTGYRLFSVVVSCKWVQCSLFSSAVSTQQFSM